MTILNKILNKTGKIFKIDAKYFFKSGSYLTATHFIDAFMRLMLSIVLARALTQISFGQFNFILAVLGTFGFLSLQGTTTSIARSVALGFDASLEEGTRDKVRFSLLGMLAMLISAGYVYIIKDEPEIAFIFIVCSLFFVPYFSLVGYESFLIGKRMFKQLAIYKSLSSVIAIIPTLLVAILTKNIFYITTTLIGMTSLLNIYFYFKTKKLKKNENIDGGVIKYGRKLTWISLVATIFINIDRLVVSYFLGFKALAVYAVAMAIPKQFRLVVKTAVSSIFPGLSVLNKEESHKVIRRRLWQMIVISAVLSLIGAALAPIAIKLLYGEQYSEAIPYAVLVFAFMWLVIPIVPIAEGLLPAQKREKRMLKLNIYTYTIYASLLLILVPRYTLAGAVWSYILVRVFTFIYLVTSLKKTED